MTHGRSRLVPLVLAAQALQGLAYIARTSFLVDDRRVFTLWDDAMISMRYAANWWQGDGLQWNPDGPPVQGISNLALAGVMALLHALPVDRFHVSLLFQLLCLAALMTCVWLAEAIARRLTRDPRAGLAAAAAVASSAPVSIWGLQGADTAFVSLWMLVALWAIAPRDDGAARWPAWLFVFLGLGMWLRMDLAIFCAVFGLASLGLPSPGRSALARAALGALQGLAIFAALIAFQTLYYGDPLPNTYYLKATGQPRDKMLLQVAAQLLVWWPILPVAALAGYGALRTRSHGVTLAAAGLFGTGLAYNVWVGGDWAVQWGSRFLVALFPVLLLWAAVGLYEGARRAIPALRRPGAAGALTALLAGLLPALLLGTSTTLREWWDPRAETMFRAKNRALVQEALWLERHTLPSTTIAVHYGGIPPYFSGRHAIDVLGKSDPWIARLEVDFFQSGHSKWDWEHVLREHRPDIFLRASRGLAARPDFRFDYFEARTPDGIELFVRKQSRYKVSDPALEWTDPVSGKRVTP